MAGENSKRLWLQGRIAAAFGPKIVIYKRHQGALAGSGEPDLFVQTPGLGGAHVELKYVRGTSFDWSKEPTKLQKARLRELWLAGANVGVVAYFEYSERWCSVHGEDLMTAIGTEMRFADIDENWTCVSKNPAGREMIASLVWGRSLL